MSYNDKMNVFDISEILFGPMRSSTDEEIELHRRMMKRNSKPYGKNLLDDEVVDIKEVEDADQ